jgi:hypothetical protein
MHEFDQQNSNLSGLLDDYLNHQILDITATSSTINQILSTLPTNDPQVQNLQMRYKAISTEANAAAFAAQQGQNEQASIRAGIVSSAVKKLYNDVINYSNQLSQQSGQIQNTGYPQKQNAMGGLIDTIKTLLTSKTFGVPNAILLVGAYIIGSHSKDTR